MAKVRQHSDEKELFAGLGGSGLLAGKPKEDGLRVIFLGAAHIKEKLTGVTLPAFDLDLDTVDEAFPLSTTPCWLNIADAKNPKHFVPATWAVPLLFYTFVGAESRHFVAPLNRKTMLIGQESQVEQDLLRDPFNDLRNAIRNHKTFTATDKDYFLKGTSQRAALVPSRQVKYLSFAKVSTREEPLAKVAILARTPTCRDFEITQMRWRTEDGAKPRSSRYPRYMLGDPTDPAGALRWWVEKYQVDVKVPQETNVLRWTEHLETAPERGFETQIITEDDLLKRFLFVDQDCWEIPTYQEMLDVLLTLDDIPHELIKLACGNFGDVGSSPPARREQPRSKPDNDDDDEQSSVLKSLGTASSLAGGVSEDDDIPFDAPPPPPMPELIATQRSVDDAPPPVRQPEDDVPPPPPVKPSVADSPPPPPAAQPRFWVSDPSRADQPTKHTEADIRALAATYPDLQVHVDDSWIPVAAFLGKRPSPEAPATVGEKAATPAAGILVSDDDRNRARATILSTARKTVEALTAGQRRYLEDLTERMVVARSKSPHLPPEIVSELVACASQAFPERAES